jgi:hypothetical protein
MPEAMVSVVPVAPVNNRPLLPLPPKTTLPVPSSVCVPEKFSWPKVLPPMSPRVAVPLSVSPLVRVSVPPERSRIAAAFVTARLWAESAPEPWVTVTARLITASSAPPGTWFVIVAVSNQWVESFQAPEPPIQLTVDRSVRTSKTSSRGLKVRRPDAPRPGWEAWQNPLTSLCQGNKNMI